MYFKDAETDAGSREYVMDSEFRWAQDNYSSTRRTVEIWAFIVRLRVSLTLMDQKWSYATGFSEEKCAKGCLLQDTSIMQSRVCKIARL